jgi:hypothetical protein
MCIKRRFLQCDAYGDDHLEVASTLNVAGLFLFKMEPYDLTLQSFMEGRLQMQGSAPFCPLHDMCSEFN